MNNDKQELAHQVNELALNMDESLAQRLLFFSEGLKMPLWIIIQNFLLADWARRCASFEVVEGGAPPRIMPEFVKEVLDNGEEKVITGGQLWDNLFNDYKKELTDQKEYIAELKRERDTLLVKYLNTPQGQAENQAANEKAEREAKQG